MARESGDGDGLLRSWYDDIKRVCIVRVETIKQTSAINTTTVTNTNTSVLQLQGFVLWEVEDEKSERDSDGDDVDVEESAVEDERDLLPLVDLLGLGVGGVELLARVPQVVAYLLDVILD